MFAAKTMLVSRSEPIRATKEPFKVFICGYYGELNLGDDLLLDTLLKSIPVQAITFITCNHSDYIKEIRENIQVIKRRSLFDIITSAVKSDVIILGGGSLLQDKTSMRSLLYYLFIVYIGYLCKIPVILWAQGFGPFRTIIGSWLTQHCLKSVDIITCRAVFKVSFKSRDNANS